MQSIGESLHVLQGMGLEGGLAYLVYALIFSWTLLVVGLVAVKSGRNMFWGFIVFAPYLLVFAVWAFAGKPWRRIHEKP